MTLNEALAAVNAQPDNPKETKVHFLACGFEALHLKTFVHANLLQRLQETPVQVQCGLYGDLLGNLSKAAISPAVGALIIIEWSDIDSRLGLRSSGGWSELIKLIAFLTGDGPDPTVKHGEQSAEEELAEILRRREEEKAKAAAATH